MKKIIFLLLLSFVFSSCGFSSERAFPVSMIIDMGDSNLELLADNEQKLLNFTLKQGENSTSAQVGDDYFDKFLDISDIVVSKNNNFEKKEFLVSVKYSDSTEYLFAFSNEESSPEILEVRSFYDEIVFLASADIE